MLPECFSCLTITKREGECREQERLWQEEERERERENSKTLIQLIPGVSVVELVTNEELCKVVWGIIMKDFMHKINTPLL